MNVSVNVPLDAPFGTAKSMVTLTICADAVSVPEDGMIVQVEPAGPSLQVRLTVPWNPVLVSTVKE